jgi:hypothetical protein
MRKAAYYKAELLTQRCIEPMATSQFDGGIDVRTHLKLLLPTGVRGEFRNFYMLQNPSFGVPPCAQNSIIWSSLEDWLSTSSRLRPGHSLVNMEDRMLDRFADHQS